jgi:hypothetical protein
VQGGEASDDRQLVVGLHVAGGSQDVIGELRQRIAAQLGVYRHRKTLPQRRMAVARLEPPSVLNARSHIFN